jgi:hypothetical protein
VGGTRPRTSRGRSAVHARDSIPCEPHLHACCLPLAEPRRCRRIPTITCLPQLLDALAARLPAEDSVLLLYLLLHGNRDFLDYCLSRTDADTLLLPLLPMLYETAHL